MASSEDLQAICAEFQQNFSSLTIRYNNLLQELEAAQVSKTNVQRQLEASQQQNERALAALREMKAELQDAQDFKEKYRSASITVEHLKGRLETARRGVADTVVEHDQLTEQLRGQIHDLLQRIEVSSDARQMSELRNQVRELEERAALVSGQLIEERERHAQQQITSNAALRELNGRNVELEQRYRSMESEVTQMRSAVRRSMDLQNEAAVQREKAVVEKQRAQADVVTARRQLHESSERTATLQTKHEEELQALRTALEEERTTLMGRVAQSVSERNDAVAARDLEEERYAALQRSVQKKVSAARQAVSEEVDHLQKLLTDERDEKLRLQAKLRTAELQCAEARQALAQCEARCAQLEQDKAQLRVQTERAVQQEAWYQAERDHMTAQLSAQRERVEALLGNAKQMDAVAAENDRLKLALHYKTADTADMQRHAEQAALQLRSVEEACDRRCMTMHKQCKVLKRQLQQEVLKSDAQRKKLMAAVVQKESALQAAQHRSRNVVAATKELAHNINAPIASYGRSGGGVLTYQQPMDALECLRPLNDQAAALEGQLAALSQQKRTSPPTSPSAPAAATS